jgi:hypothetical protein
MFFLPGGSMESIPCQCCDVFFIPRNKLQIFCSSPGCQRARKALWQKRKIATDSEYKKDQDLANQKWLQNNLIIGRTIAIGTLIKGIETILYRKSGTCEIRLPNHQSP